MKKVKLIGISIVVIIGIVGISWMFGDWTLWYRARLDSFFGKGNWEVVSEDAKLEKERTYIVRSNSSLGGYGQGQNRRLYRNWNILCENKDGDKEIWEISNHAYMINKERYKIYSSKRYKARQALTLELMEISFDVVEKEVHKEIVSKGLTDEEADCIYVELSYHDGNPPRSFYDKLAKEDWFTIEGVTAENYLKTELYDFYLIIRIYDYRLEKLSGKEQENVINGLVNIEERLLEKYGEDASFQILYGENNIRYKDGEKE